MKDLEPNICSEKGRQETEGQIAFRFGEYLSDEAFDLLGEVLAEAIKRDMTSQ